jgi:hypothetical protein
MRKRFSIFAIGCAIAVVPVALLSWRLIWEQTSLSWERGPQMVGFSLMHSGLGIILVLALYAALLWAGVTLVFALASPKHRRALNFAAAALVVLVAVPALAPYGLWVRLFASKIAGSPHASEFLVHMAALGDITAVRALLDAGVPINGSNKSGLRAIEAATNAKQRAMREYLLTRGGNDKRL